MSIKQTKRTMRETSEQFKDLMGIKRDYRLADVLGVNPVTFSNAIARNSILYPELLEYCRVKKLDILSLLYRTEVAS